MSQTEDALQNLKAIQNGEDPRSSTDEPTADVEIIDADNLEKRHNTIVRDRDTINEDFVAVVNAVKPENKYHKDCEAVFPITKRDVEFSYCTSSGRYWAKCGPRSSPQYAFFAADKEGMGSMTAHRYWAVLIHEATHIEEGSQSPGSAHNPKFWEEVAKNTAKFINSDAMPATLDVDKLVSQVRDDPNRSMTDRRMMTVEEQKQQIEDDILKHL